MLTKSVALTGAVPKLKPEDARRLAAFVVRGSEVLASAPLGENGRFSVQLSRQAAAGDSRFALELVVAPAGMTHDLSHLPSLPRVRLDRARILEAERDIAVETKGVAISEETLLIWWRWCYDYCVSGTLVGPDGCPVPGAEVTVYNVDFYWLGFSKTPEVTVTTDQFGQFKACFPWCAGLCCNRCWPCWPIWWDCWPWWWELDILHVIETLENLPDHRIAQLGGIQNASVLMKPVPETLIRGQGFAAMRKLDAEFAPDPARTDLIRRKLSNIQIREMFPWWWWCCDNPNIVFSATQGGNVVLDENPAFSTRWCLPNDSNVTLVANNLAVTHCPGGPPPEEGFMWTRVGNIVVANIHDGYADGTLGSDTSDLAFAGTLDIYGGFALSTNMTYYQVDAGQWVGDPARGGTAPGSSSPLSATLSNYVWIYDSGFKLTFNGSIGMGPFSHGGLTNLYSTTAARPTAPTGTGLSAFPPIPLGGFVFWAYEGLMVSTYASNLVGGVLVGAADLTLSGYDASFNLVTLSPDDALTLTVDDTGLSEARIINLQAWTAPGHNAPLTSSGDCSAYDIGPNGFVTIDVIVTDATGHLWEYEVDAEWGHNSSATVPPGNRGYAFAGPWPTLPYQAPNLGQKSFVGGEETLTYHPTTSCCYEFRIRAGKRVTDGYGYPSLGDYDFLTISLSLA